MQPLDKHLRNIAAAIATNVHNQCFLANLRIVELQEFADAGRAHVGNMNVADASIGSFRDGIAIVIDPIQIDEISFRGDRAVADAPGAVG